MGRAALALALVVAACDRAAHAPEQQKTVPALVAPTRTESPTADPAQQPACTLEPWAPAGPEDEALLVLVGDETSVATYWVQRQGRATRWLGWSDSAIFTWNGGVWRAGSEHHEQKTEGCQTNPDAPAEPGTATTEHLVLLRLDAPGRIEPLGSPQVPRARRDASSESRVIGLVGPYLCIRSDDSADDCGAHGNASVKVSAVHLGTGKAPKLTLPPTIEAKAMKQARAYQKEMEDSGLLRVRWEATLPTFDGGKLAANFVFVTATNYVASSWGSYQHAVFVEGPLPQQLASFASAPSLVTTLKCESGHVVGFTQPPPGAASNEAIRRAFQPAPR